jgi:hypothetical protein
MDLRNIVLYQALFEEYADSTILHFAYGASDGCMNEKFICVSTAIGVQCEQA